MRDEAASGAVVLASAGLLLALLLPYAVHSLLSAEAIRESKLFASAVGASLSAAGLALDARGRAARAASDTKPLWARFASVAVAVSVACGALSAIRAAAWVDPLTLAALLPATALFWCGASRHGGDMARAAFPALMAAGAATGLLAFVQRTTGLFRWDVEAPEPRFFATALIGNPGDVGAALVLPALLLWFAAISPERSPRSRILAGAGFVFALAGVGATGSAAPLLSILVGVALHGLLELRKRRLYLAVAAGAAAVTLLGTDAGARLQQKGRELLHGRIADAVTQRDIGVLAAVEMIRARPLLGVGPGAYENAFVPARLAAEERWSRRLVHLSESAHFDNAHDEPLTLAAECGVPAALAALGATGALFFGLARRHRRRREAPRGSSPPADVLLAIATAFLALSLGGFPFRLAASGGAAAFVAGLAWAAALDVRALDAPSSERRSRAPVVLALLAAATAAFGALRGLAVYRQARGEAALLAAAADATGARAALLASARSELTASLTLRPRRPTALLALGSVERLEGNLDGAWERLARSHALEERAETCLGLGRVAFEKGRTADAEALFVRALWVLPRLRSSLPDELDAASLVSRVEAFEERLAAGIPPLPASLAPSRPLGR